MLSLCITFRRISISFLRTFPLPSAFVHVSPCLIRETVPRELTHQTMADNGDAAGGNSADGVQDLTAVVQTLLTQMVREGGDIEHARDVAIYERSLSNSTAERSKTACHMKRRKKKEGKKKVNVAVVCRVGENTKNVLRNKSRE